ncbi:uncharacterized protein [Cebidichthys violaceus]|uniref:uncharacterized protein isoform X3 n=1 Tax=Cebidichthys violaceus TaxID=271503 RepID=UPI0035CBDC41
MITGLAALILLSTLSLVQTADVPHQISWTVLELGDNLTLSCTFLENEVGLFFWYKLKFGYMVQTVAVGTYSKITLEEQFDKSRFSVTKVNDQYVLDIRNVSKEDEATYFCQAGSAYMMKIINGTLLAVKDFKNQQRSFYVKQSPETESVQPGDSTSDAGTYYCAVATCGEILFGEGTKVETKPELYTSLIVVGTLLGCCVIVIAALIISRNQKPVCKHCKGEASNHAQHDRSAEDQPSNVDGEAAAVNYAALDFPSRGARRWKNNRELPQECLYSLTQENMSEEKPPRRMNI